MSKIMAATFLGAVLSVCAATPTATFEGGYPTRETADVVEDVPEGYFLVELALDEHFGRPALRKLCSRT